MINQKFINPVFESLNNEVRKIQSRTQFTIYEEAKEEMKREKFEDSIINIIQTIIFNIAKYIQIIPDQKLKNNISPKVMEEIIKLGENASLKDLMESIYDIWNIAYEEVKKSDNKKLIAVFEKVNEGMDKLFEAHKDLKERGITHYNNEEVLKTINTKMQEIINAIRDQLKDAKKILEK